jgi:hypothetical protein
MALPTDINPFVQFAGASGPDLGDPIAQSLRFSGGEGNSGRLTRTFAQNHSSNSATVSYWLKRAKLGTLQTVGCMDNGQNELFGRFNTSDQYVVVAGGGGGVTTAKRFRDVSAWYHFVLTQDRLWVNGVQVANTTLIDNITTKDKWNIGLYGANLTQYFDGYIAEYHFIDGTNKQPTDFGRFNNDGIWVPIEYTGDHGNANGFHLTFDSSQANGIGHDSSGKGNHFTASGFGTTANTGELDIDFNDTPTKNHAIGNPLMVRSNQESYPGQDFINFQYGNLRTVGGSTSAVFIGANPTIYWDADDHIYFEVRMSNFPTNTYCQFTADPKPNYGLQSVSDTSSTGYIGFYNTSINDPSPGGVFSGLTFTGTTTLSGNKNVGFEWDGPNRRLKIYEDGTLLCTSSQWSSSSDLNRMSYAFDANSDWSSPRWSINYGQQPFQYLPAGLVQDEVSIHTNNLYEPTINNGSDHFRTLLGSGANILAIAQGTNTSGIDNWNTNVNTGFTSGLWWIKDYTQNSTQHQFVDSIHGTSSVSKSPAPTAPGAYSAPTGASVAWCWSASQSFTGTGVDTGLRNPTSKFSIIKYTGDGTSSRNIEHGLGVKPGFIIHFDPSANDTRVWVEGIGGTGSTTKNGILNTGEAASDQFGAGTIQDPDATNIPLGVSAGGGNTSAINTDGTEYRMYVWAPVEGYSQMGKYFGRNDDDSTWFYCGFRPAWIMLKNHDSATNWTIYDTTRRKFNPMNTVLFANSSDDQLEGGFYEIDILANGFKLRRQATDVNVGGGVAFTYIAFAETPMGGYELPPTPAF